MAYPEQDIEDLDRRAAGYERVAQRTLKFGTWLKNEVRAAELRRRIEGLKQQAAKAADADSRRVVNSSSPSRIPTRSRLPLPVARSRGVEEAR